MVLEIKNWAIGVSALLGGLATKMYTGPNQEFIHAYGWDFALPIYLSNINSFLEKDSSRILGSLGLCSLGEICQYLGLYPGTYDPKDFIAYGAGAGVAFGISKAIKHFSKPKVLENLAETN